MMPQYTNFNRLANGVISDVTQRTRIIAAAVAIAVATQASLPTAPVDSPALHFANAALGSVSDRVSSLNESLIFDCKQAMAWAREIWLLRYGAVHPVAKPIFATSASCFESLIGLTNCLSADSIEFFNTHKVAIMALAGEVSKLLAEMKEPVCG